MAFSESEFRRALTPHLTPDKAAAEAATIIAGLRDAEITGATLNDEILAMLHMMGGDVAVRVERYRDEALEGRRQAWLRRELRFSDAGEEALVARWDAFRAERDAEWENLLGRVRAAVEQAELREAGLDSSLVQLGGAVRRPVEPESDGPAGSDSDRNDERP